MSLFHRQTSGPISTKFYTDPPTNSGKVLNASLTPLTRPPDRTPGYQRLQNLKRSLEKKLCFTKNALNFSQAVAGPSRLVKDIYRYMVWILKNSFKMPEPTIF